MASTSPKGSRWAELEQYRTSTRVSDPRDLANYWLPFPAGASNELQDLICQTNRTLAACQASFGIREVGAMPAGPELPAGTDSVPEASGTGQVMDAHSQFVAHLNRQLQEMADKHDAAAKAFAETCSKQEENYVAIKNDYDHLREFLGKAPAASKSDENVVREQIHDVVTDVQKHMDAVIKLNANGGGLIATAKTIKGQPQVGALYDEDGNSFGTATVVRSPNGSTILTAGHVGEIINKNLAQGKQITFVPGANAGEAPYGSWVISKPASIDPQYTELGHKQGAPYDLAYARVDTAPDGKTLEQAVGGGLEQDFSAGPVNKVRVIGYPNSSRAKSQPIEADTVTERFMSTDPKVPGNNYMEIVYDGFKDGTSGSPLERNGKIIGVLGGWHTGGDVDWMSTFDTSDKNFWEAVVEGEEQ